MPIKYPGGYQIIDLGGILIKKSGESDPVEVKGLFYKIINSKKPVILTNFRLSGDAIPKAPDYGVRVVALADDETEFYSEALTNQDSITVIRIQGSNPASEDEMASLSYTCRPYYTE